MRSYLTDPVFWSAVFVAFGLGVALSIASAEWSADGNG